MNKINRETVIHNIKAYDGFNITAKIDYPKDGDGILTHLDFTLTLQGYKDEVFNSISTNNDTWLKANYSVHLTSKWFKEHFALPSNSNVLMKLTIPIHIFRGEYDSNIPFSDIENLKEDIDRYKKTNIKIHTFSKHDHDLNYLTYPIYGKISEGLQTVFKTAGTI